LFKNKVLQGKETIFSSKSTLNLNGRLFDIQKPKVVGILNITTDSFFDGGKYQTETQIIKRVEEMMREGADIIDIGAQSTRPGAEEVPLEEEIKQIQTASSLILKEFPEAILSIDTYRASVAKAGFDHGALMINDISGGTLDNQMLSSVAAMNIPYILMHSKGTPKTMQSLTHYDNFIQEVILNLQERLYLAKELGIKDIIIDPGFGFAKSLDQNYSSLKKLSYINMLDCPILVGLSRKSMIWKFLELSPDEALNGTTALNTIALLNGAKIIRVHDVKEAKQTIKLVEKLRH
jgi:dihydropteroate synthase